MKKSLIYTITLCLLSISLVSCEKFLDREPVSITHPKVFWVNQANAEQALAGAYALYKYAMLYESCFLYWGERPAMTFMNSRCWVDDYIEGSGNYVLAYRDQSVNWKNLYRAANWAHTINKYVTDMPVSMFTSQSEKDRILGEAAFIRSLTYFTMARIWGDVPIIDMSIESSDQLVTEDGYIVRVPREPELKVLALAYKEANRADSLLQYSAPGNTGWAITANKGSAQALKAHIALWYASRDNDNAAMIQKSIDAATSCINFSGASLIDYVAEGNTGFTAMCVGQSKTGLFEINMSFAMNETARASTSDAGWICLTLNFPYPLWKSLNSKAPFIDPAYYGNAMMATDPDRVNDSRKTLFFYQYGTNPESYCLKYSHSVQDPASTSTTAVFTEDNILIFRLADMYLLRAEALAKQNKGPEAVLDLNLIRSKAGVPAYTGATDRASMMKAIFDERAIEFMGEATAAYDRIRMDYYYDGVPWMNLDRINKKGYFWPIAASIISNNPSIIQNEFWRGKI